MAAALVVLLVLLSEAAAGEDVVQVKHGDNVILTCRAAGDIIRAVMWTREDLEDKSVLFYRDNKTETDNQDPSFKDRVQLLDRKLKDGDVSLILRNVNVNDTGTYECGVASGGSRQKRAPADVIRSIQLKVSGSDRNPPDGNVGVGGVGGVVGVAVGVLLCSAVVLFLVQRYKRQTVQGPVPPLPDEAAGDHLI